MMRIVWGLHDRELNEGSGGLMCLFETQDLLEHYRDDLLRRWYDELTAPLPPDILPTDGTTSEDRADAERRRTELLNSGYDTWRGDQIYSDPYPRYLGLKYEMWNSVPPNAERLVLHMDVA